MTTKTHHNGRPITGRKIEIRKTGGAFSEDLLLANPELLDDVDAGAELTLAMRVVCIDEHFPAEDRKEPADGGVIRKVVFDPREVTIVDPTTVAPAFAGARVRIEIAKAEAEGQTTVDGQILEKLADAHAAGDHASGLVEGCPECDEERDLGAFEDGVEEATPARLRRTKRSSIAAAEERGES